MIGRIIAVAIATMTASSPASVGTGCNGVVNVLVWGCAPQDNNAGPKFAYFRKSTTMVIPKKVQYSGSALIATTADGRTFLVAPQDTARGQKLITDNGGAVVSSAGGGLAVHTGQWRSIARQLRPPPVTS